MTSTFKLAARPLRTESDKLTIISTDVPVPETLASGSGGNTRPPVKTTFGWPDREDFRHQDGNDAKKDPNAVARFKDGQPPV